MLIELASHNADIQRLLDKGYALRYDSETLVVRDILYLDSEKRKCTGAIVAKLVFIDKVRVKQDDHQVYFAGSVPYGLDGKPVPNLAGGLTTIALKKNDVVVERSFSNKPPNGFPDFFEKIEHYVNLLSGPAIALHGGSPLTYRVDHDVVEDSVFKFRDTLTSSAEISDMAALLKNEIVAVIGLGGTGAYLVDYLVKSPVKEVRGFDGDEYYVHNAYRSPGELVENDLGKGKAIVFQRRYDNFRKGLSLQQKYIDSSCAADLKGVTFAFVCVDKGSSRSEIFNLLISLKIPFIDVGMGLNRKRGPLAGALRFTYYSAADAQKIRDMQLAEMVDDPDDIYRKNVQIAEINALNASLALIRYKQTLGFYFDDNAAYHLLMSIEDLSMSSLKA